MVGRTCRFYCPSRSPSHILTITQHFVRKLSKQHVLNEGLTIYRRLQSDDQDSVRLLTVEDLIAIAQQLSPAEVKEQLLKQIRQSMTDKSWRVRYMAALHFNEVSTYISGPRCTPTESLQLTACRSCRPRPYQGGAHPALRPAP